MGHLDGIHTLVSRGPNSPSIPEHIAFHIFAFAGACASERPLQTWASYRKFTPCRQVFASCSP